MSSPGSLLDPSLAAQWQNNQFTPPNTAVESSHIQWHQPSPEQDDTPVSQTQQTWPKGSFAKHDLSQSYSKAEADFHQQAMAFDGVSQVHNRNDYPSPPGVHNNIPGEPPQSKASAVDDLFSDVDDNEMPDFDAVDQGDNIFEMSGLGQPQNLTQQDSNISLQTIPDIYQTPYHATLIGTNDFAGPTSHPSPTESQLIAQGFEFHNELPEEVQINRFNDKAFRKALREVQSDLPRKQQWYAWSKAKQMLNSEPESTTTTEQMVKNWGEPLKRQDQNGHEHEHEHEHEHQYKHEHEHQYKHEHEHQYEYEPELGNQHQHEHQPEYSREIGMPPTNHTATSELEDGVWGLPAQSTSLSNTVHGRSGHEGEKDHTADRHFIAQVPQGNRSSSPASTGSVGVGQGDWHVSHEARSHGDWASKPVQIDQDLLKKHHSLEKLVSEVADQHRARRQSEDEGAAENAQETHPSQPVATSRQNSNVSASAAAIVTAKKLDEIRSLREKLHKADEQILSKMKEALKIKMVARREGSAHGLLSRLNSSPVAADTDMQDHSPQDTKQEIPTAAQNLVPPAQPSATAPALPPRPPISHLNSSTSILGADLLRPHTNNLLRRSPSPSPSLSHHLPPTHFAEPTLPLPVD